jgi:hypothetical protein
MLSCGSLKTHTVLLLQAMHNAGRCIHKHIFGQLGGAWVIRTTCVRIKGAMEKVWLAITNNLLCKRRHLDSFMTSTNGNNPQVLLPQLGNVV